MPRQVRIEYEGTLYHVIARANRHNRIFVSPDGGDEMLFLKSLEPSQPGPCPDRAIGILRRAAGLSVE